VIAHRCRHGLLFIVRLDDDLYLDAKVVESHIVFDNYHCRNRSVETQSHKNPIARLLLCYSTRASGFAVGTS
jgi:hypothetical protein